MSLAYLCGCVIRDPGVYEVNDYCSEHLPPAGVKALRAECGRYKADLERLKLAVGQDLTTDLAVEIAKAMREAVDAIGMYSTVDIPKQILEAAEKVERLRDSAKRCICAAVFGVNPSCPKHGRSK